MRTRAGCSAPARPRVSDRGRRMHGRPAQPDPGGNRTPRGLISRASVNLFGQNLSLLPAMKHSRTLATLLCVAAAAHAAPNVVFILADDLGYGDVSCDGQGKIRTPHIDRLAAGGVRFTSGYAPSSTCTPTRYAIMTGEYAWRKPGTGILPGDSPLIISPSRVTLPRLFQEAGYATAAIGKWHLGMGSGRPDFNGLITPGSRELGFDFTFQMAATGDRVPCVYIENGRVVNLDPKDPIRVSYSAALEGEAPTLRQLRERRAKGGTDAEPRPGDPAVKLDSFEGHADAIINGIPRIGHMTGGKSALWDDHTLSDTFNAKALEFIRKNRSRPFFLYYAAHKPHAPRDPNPRFVGKSGLGARGDAILQFDEQVGKILDTLKAEGLEENTLVILSSDNGPAVADGYRDGALATETRRGHHANGVFRGGKYNDYEGGVRMPLILRWPGKIPAGSVSDVPVSLVDLPATAATLTGRTLPADAAPDSVDLIPAATGKPVHEFLLFGNPSRVGKAAAIREGNWKLIVVRTAQGTRNPPNNGPDPTGVPQLFDLAQDPREERNIAAAHPEIVDRLSAHLAKAESDGFTRPGGRKAPVR